VTVTVLSSGLSSSQFEANFTHANVGSTSEAAAFASPSPDNWIVNQSYGIGINAYNNSTGGGITPAGVGGEGVLLSPVATPTTTLKTGTGNGTNYTSMSISYAPVDSTNLAYTVTIPVGWKLLISASGGIQCDTTSVQVLVAIYDGSNAVAVSDSIPAVGTLTGWSMNTVINGDGASHPITLQFKTTSTMSKVEIVNNTCYPMMTFFLTPSN
jgi:hypothetical protein